jgi:hypothetical protein
VGDGVGEEHLSRWRAGLCVKISGRQTNWQSLLVVGCEMFGTGWAYASVKICWGSSWSC